MQHTILALAATTLLAGCSAFAQMPQPTAQTSGNTHVEFLDSGRFGDLPFSDGVRVGNVIYFSGEIGYDAASKKLVPGGIKAETWKIMNNIKASVEANGYRMQDIVKCTAMLADMAEWPAFNEIYRSYFSKPYPARSAFGVNGLAMGARVEMECIAAR
ncbi:RidA family protein [Variovorax sp. LT1R16]|uniref:RidA family protein n=1 Tax=Variovorax sp. LT1R16 TaxID=3443728 RepID=UPI003F45107B